MENELSRKWFSDRFEAAKAGQAVEIYNDIVARLGRRLPPEESTHYVFGWIIYYALHQSADSDIINRRKMLSRYVKLHVPRPHKLHSMIMTEAVRLSKDSGEQAFVQRKNPLAEFSFPKFLKYWDLENLRPGDWKRKEIDGKTTSSLVEKIITRYVSDTGDNHYDPSPAILKLVDEALEQFPDSANLKSQASDLLRKTEDGWERSLQLAREAVLLAPGKFYLWSRLADHIDHFEKPNLSFSLEYKALSAPGPKEYKINIIIALAAKLIDHKAYPQALYLLDQADEISKKQGWKISDLSRSMRSRIPAGTEPKDPTPGFKKIAHLADEFVYEALPSIAVTKTYHKNPSESRYKNSPTAWRVTDATGHSFWFTPSRFGINPDLPLGTSLTIRVSADKIVHAVLNK